MRKISQRLFGPAGTPQADRRATQRSGVTTSPGEDVDVTFQRLIEIVGTGVDFGGVVIVVVGVLLASVLALRMAIRHVVGGYEAYRRLLGRSILLGLEFLVAADIIRTVAVTPTFRSVGVLAVIVLIRTFLSFSLELEITGRWPWQKTPNGRPQT
jgi:uncharacterized membrane protein